ncbi:MAG: hypothetical protein WBM92_11235 [Aureibaculum sp.]
MDQATVDQKIIEKKDASSLDQFEQKLTVFKNQLSLLTTANDLQNLLLNDFSSICDFYVTIGDKAFEGYTDELNTNETVEIYLLNYKITDIVKSFFILHRNVLLELTKAQIINQEKKLDKKAIIDHFNRSQKVLIDAVDDLLQKIKFKKNQLLKKKNIKKGLINKMRLHLNPWDVYKQQIIILQQHLQQVNDSKHTLFRTILGFQNIKNSINKVSDTNNKLYEKYEKAVLQIENSLKEEKALELLKNEALEFTQSGLTGNDLMHFTEDLINHVELLEKIEIPISSKEGMLNIREVNLNKTVQKWLDYQVLTEFMDLIGLEESTGSKFQLAIANVKNSIQLAKNMEAEIDYQSLRSTIANLKSVLSSFKLNSDTILTKINDEIQEEFLVSNLFKNKPFLEVAIQSSINLGGTTLLKEVKARFENLRSYFNAQYKKTNYQDSFSNIELASRCITYRMLAKEDENYDILFLTKHFIGDIFLVPREFQEQQLQEAINHWNQGFNKAVLIEGDRLSGKSTFLDYTSKKYFGKEIVQLKPNSTSVIDGRKFKTTKDLKEALQYVKNNNVKNTRPILIIDDIELWLDAEHHFLDNIRALINFIENESDEIFLVLATSSDLVSSLDNRLGFSKIFSTVINMNNTDKEEVLRAILLRHGASHKTLVSQDKEPISDGRTQKIINKLSKQHQNNIGVVLQAWTYNTMASEEDKVIYNEIEFEFVDFFTNEELIVLKQASIFKRITELGIKRVTSSKYETNFKSAIKRLINTKVLLRDESGSLYINPVILSEVGFTLKSKGLIN